MLESRDEAGRLREVSMQEAQQREAARALDDGSDHRVAFPFLRARNLSAMDLRGENTMVLVYLTF